MRTIDEIVADSQKVNDAALREAFEAGRTGALTELMAKFSAVFDEMLGRSAPHQEASQPVEQHEHTEHHEAHDPELIRLGL